MTPEHTRFTAHHMAQLRSNIIANHHSPHKIKALEDNVNYIYDNAGNLNERHHLHVNV